VHTTTPSPEPRHLDHELMKTAGEGDLARLKELLALGADPRAAEPEWPRNTALCAATLADENDAAACVALLLPLSDANHKGPNGTALCSAASQGDAESVRLLIPASDASLLDEDGHTALMGAILAGSVECVRLLIPVSDVNARAQGARAGRNALMVAASSNDENTGAFIALLAAQMTDEELDAVDEQGETALMLAACSAPNEGDDVDFAPLLGRADANLRADCGGADTALKMAIANGDLRAAQALAPFTDLSSAAPVSPMDDDFSPLEFAVARGQWEIADFLAPLSSRTAADFALAVAKGRMPLWLAHCEEEALRQVVQEARAAHESAAGENEPGDARSRSAETPAKAVKRTPRAL